MSTLWHAHAISPRLQVWQWALADFLTGHRQVSTSAYSHEGKPSMIKQAQTQPRPHNPHMNGCSTDTCRHRQAGKSSLISQNRSRSETECRSRSRLEPQHKAGRHH